MNTYENPLAFYIKLYYNNIYLYIEVIFMVLYLQSVDRYHCNIYRRWFFFFYKHIAEAELDFEDRVTVYFYKMCSNKTKKYFPEILSSIRDFMLEQREA